MPRQYDDRAMRGKTKIDLRTALSPAEERELLDHYRAIAEVKREFEDMLTSLYLRGVSQAALGRALGWTQQRVGIRIQRYRSRPSVLR